MPINVKKQDPVTGEEGWDSEHKDILSALGRLEELMSQNIIAWLDDGGPVDTSCCD